MLAFAAVTQYQLAQPKNGGTVPGYSFPVFLVGTLGLGLGLFFCSELIEKSTIESRWNPACPARTSSVWLQQGGQVVGDQEFQAFSWNSTKTITRSENRRGAKEVLRPGRVILAILITLFSFITQFFGLRAAHSSVIVLQLGAILVMTALRSWANLKRQRENQIPDPADIEGFELDWLAKNLTGCSSWDDWEQYIVDTGRRVGPYTPRKQLIWTPRRPIIPPRHTGGGSCSFSVRRSEHGKQGMGCLPSVLWHTRRGPQVYFPL